MMMRTPLEVKYDRASVNFVHAIIRNRRRRKKKWDRVLDKLYKRMGYVIY